MIDEVDDDAAAFGITLPDLPPPVAQDFEVWSENWPTVQMFLRLQTQWRTAMNGVVGLDYAAARWLFKLYEVDDPRSLLEALQVMEAAAMAKMNNQKG